MIKTKILLFIVIILLALPLLVPFFTFAQPLTPPLKAGLVQCGTEKDREGKITNPCTPCDLVVLANKIITFLFTMIIAPLVALGILASGIVLLTAGGSESQLAKGKSMLWNILIGFFIAVSAWVIINTILGSIVKQEFYNTLTESFPGCSSQTIAL